MTMTSRAGFWEEKRLECIISSLTCIEYNFLLTCIEYIISLLTCIEYIISLLTYIEYIISSLANLHSQEALIFFV